MLYSKGQGPRERENKERTVWKRAFKGDSMVIGDGGWAEAASLYIAQTAIKIPRGGRGLLRYD